jgi:hypothetical protein
LSRQSAELEFELELGLALMEHKFWYQLEFCGGTQVPGLFIYAVGAFEI